MCMCSTWCMRVSVCTCVSVFVMISTRLHDGHNISDYRIDIANAASAFCGQGNRSDHNTLPADAA